MTPSRYLLGATLLCWTWRGGHWLVGPILACLLELPYFIKQRFEFAPADFSRIWDLCNILFLGSAFYCYLTVETVRAIFVFTEWSPVIFAPIVLAQALSTSPLLPAATFSWFIRHQKRVNLTPRIDTRPFYFALCAIALSASNQRTPWLYPALALLIGWCLWLYRPGRSGRFAWIAIFAALAAGSYYVETHVGQVQAVFESRLSDLIGRFGRRVPDATESHTQIGAVGELQQSRRIAFRVRSRSKVPELLREASYIRYTEEFWSATRKEDFVQVRPENGSSWVFHQHQTNFAGITISMEMPGGRAVLPLPSGTFRIDDLPATFVDTNSLGAVRVLEGPGFASYEAHYAANTVLDAPPRDEDLLVPENETALETVVQKLGLRDKRLPEAMHTLENFFQSEFRYTLYQPSDNPYHRHSGFLSNPPRRQSSADSPLGNFLLRRKAGHCEYFATATTLLLRRAGFYARYAVGFAVEPAADSDGEHLVRESDAHAWCLVYLNHAWVDFDTTPGNWEAVERTRAHFWEPIYDFASGLWYKFSRWRWLGSRDEMLYLIWIFVPLTAFMIWRIVATLNRQKKSQSQVPAHLPPPRPGLDSEFYQLEARLFELGHLRDPAESIRNWFNRIQATLPAGLDRAKFKKGLGLHYRYRFDPRGLSREEKEALAENIHERLRELKVTS